MLYAIVRIESSNKLENAVDTEELLERLDAIQTEIRDLVNERARIEKELMISARTRTNRLLGFSGQIQSTAKRQWLYYILTNIKVYKYVGGAGGSFVFLAIKDKMSPSLNENTYRTYIKYLKDDGYISIVDDKMHVSPLGEQLLIWCHERLHD